MGRKRLKKEIEVFFYFIVFVIILAPIAMIVQLVESYGIINVLVIFVSIIILIVVIIKIQNKKKYYDLLSKYDDEEIISKILAGNIWVGQTSIQLVDSIGNPEDIEQKVLKTKKKEIWKYNHQGGNRYNLRITLDNDIVVGWDKK